MSSQVNHMQSDTGSIPTRTGRPDQSLTGTVILPSLIVHIARLQGHLDSLRRWEKAARESTYVCNQAARFSRCLSKVQQGMQSQLKVLQSGQTKAKSSGKIGTATEELHYLMNFHASITQCMAKAMEHLSDFAFVSMAKVTLVRRDSYLAHVKSGLKQDTLLLCVKLHWTYLHCSWTLY